MLITINRLQDRANQIIVDIFFENHLNRYLQDRKINQRQYAILTQLRDLAPLARSSLNNLPWYKALYDRLTKQTKSRDLRELQDLNLIYFEDQDTIQRSNFKPKVLLSAHPDTQPDK